MKRIIPSIALIAITGCAFVHSTTKVTPNPANTNQLVSVTHVTAYALFDANSSMAKFANRAGTNNGTFIGGLNESASGTNAVAALKALADFATALSKLYP